MAGSGVPSGENLKCLCDKLPACAAFSLLQHSQKKGALPPPPRTNAPCLSLSLSLSLDVAVCCIYLASVPFRLGSWIDFPASFTACGLRCMIRHAQKDPAPTKDEVPRCKGSRNVFVIDKAEESPPQSEVRGLDEQRRDIQAPGCVLRPNSEPNTHGPKPRDPES